MLSNHTTRGQQGRLHIVEVEYLDDCRYPEAEQVLWENCRKDAIALLGGQEALEAYIAQATATSEEADDEDEGPDPNHSGPNDPFGNPISSQPT